MRDPSVRYERNLRKQIYELDALPVETRPGEVIPLSILADIDTTWGPGVIRPCLMTTLTTIIALLPVILATGRGSDVAKAIAWPGG